MPEDTKAVECICDDPFREGECPVHPPEEPEGGYPEPPTPEVFVITAQNRVEPTKKSVWAGFSFLCSACGEASIMHWGDKGFEYCPACGVKLEYDWEK